MKLTLRVVCLTVLFIQTTHAQFIVQPMRMDVSGRPGVRLRGYKIVLENRSADENYYIGLRIADLVQTDTGNWSTLDAENVLDPTNKIDLSNHKSCKDWLTLRTSATEIEIEALNRVPIDVDISIPPGVRGFYCAAIVASLQPRQDEIGVAVTYDFVVPVLITIDGRPLRHDIKMVSAGMEHIAATFDTPASTAVTIGVENTGETYGKIVGVTRIVQLIGERKVPVVNETVFDEVGIIPSSKLTLKSDLKKTLPSGRYRVRAAMFVDGLRIRDIEQDVDFVGDGTGAARADATVQVDPSLIIDALPGRTQTERISIRNNSSDDITIKAFVQPPKALVGKALYNVPGQQLMCNEWIEVRPAELPLRQFASRNISIYARMPDKADRPELPMEPGAYYADLLLYAYHKDGTSAGVFHSKICVRDMSVTPQYVLKDRFWEIETLGGSKSKVTIEVDNLGFIHAQPKCMASIYTANNNEVLRFPLESGPTESLMLPFERRTFSAEIDCSNIPIGNYRLEAFLEVVPGQAIDPRPNRTIEVFVQNNEKEMEIVTN